LASHQLNAGGCNQPSPRCCLEPIDQHAIGRVYRSSLEVTWRNLHALLHDAEPIDALIARLRSLGSSLGEEVLQDLVKPLETESNGILARDKDPHLTLQMPRDFLRSLTRRMAMAVPGC